MAILTYMTIGYFNKKPHSNYNKTNHSDLCLNPKCVRNAANILKKIDSNVEPCYDFYKFTCGRFIREETVPEEDTELSPFKEVGHKIEKKFNDFLESDYDNNNNNYETLMKIIYKTCMNQNQIESNGLKKIKQIFAEAGGWPMMLQPNQWNTKKFDWKSLIYFFKKRGLSHNMFFTLYIDVDYANTTQRKITISQPWMDVEAFRLGLNSTEVQHYYDYMVDVAEAFGLNRQKAQIEMKQVLDFKINLAKIMVPNEDRINLTTKYNLMTIRELQKEYSTIPWLQYVNVMLAPIDSISWDEGVIVQLPKYLSNLENLLFKTPKQIIANYMFWYIIDEQIPYLPKNLNNIKYEYKNKRYGIKQKPPRWRKCVWESLRLNLAAGSIYSTKFFNDKSKIGIFDLINDIKAAFLDIIQSNNWMDKKTKRQAMIKAERMTAFVGHSKELRNKKEIEDYYKTLTLTSDDFLELHLNLSIFEHNKAIEQLRQPVVKNDWKSYTALPCSVDVIYNYRENSIKIPIEILQDPIYDADRPQYMNYGALGYIIGHEITHGFDNIGRQYDKDGNLADLWDTISNAAFNKKAQCIVEQFSNYTIPEINVSMNSEMTKSENIADNAGIRIAYNAYQKWLMRTDDEEPLLPGLPYTPRQMFWISAAMNYCTKYKKEWLTELLTKHPNPPNYFRVVLPFMNSRYFARDFRCILGAPMNPKYKCQVW